VPTIAAVGFVIALVAVAAGIGLLLLGLRIVGMISKEQNRTGFSDTSNRVGRVLTGVFGAFSSRRRH
jgi:L-asparagine transporter-like permease